MTEHKRQKIFERGRKNDSMIERLNRSTETVISHASSGRKPIFGNKSALVTNRISETDMVPEENDASQMIQKMKSMPNKKNEITKLLTNMIEVLEKKFSAMEQCQQQNIELRKENEEMRERLKFADEQTK